MAILTSIVNWLSTKRINQIDHFRKYPVETQKETIFKLLAKAAATEWGQKYKYSSITTIREYQERIPVQTYEDIIPYVDRRSEERRVGEECR